MSKWKIVAIAVALLAVALSLWNASWIAPAPAGRLLLIADRGIGQRLADAPADPPCSARIVPTDSNFIENSVFSMQHAVRLGADLLALDVVPTRDGRMVVFRDRMLDCRTNARGPVAERTLEELKALDIGHGYTPGGANFPLRGRGVGAMPAVEDVLQRVPRTPIVFRFTADEPREADLLAAAIARAGAPIDMFGFTGGGPAVLARMREIAPGAWVFSAKGMKACMADYVTLGWTGMVPDSCRGETVGIDIDNQWTIWGWPKRFLARMGGADVRTLVAAGFEDGGVQGLSEPEQLGEVPRAYRGYLWVDDFERLGRALR